MYPSNVLAQWNIEDQSHFGDWISVEQSEETQVTDGKRGFSFGHWEDVDAFNWDCPKECYGVSDPFENLTKTIFSLKNKLIYTTICFPTVCRILKSVHQLPRK